LFHEPDLHPQKEQYCGSVNPIGPRACYDEGKRCAETLFLDYRRQHGLKIKVVWIFNTYGPKMRPNDGRVVSNFIVQALRGEPIEVFGDGSQTRSFCYVDDLVDGLIRVMNTHDSFTGPMNLGNPCEFSILELAELVLKHTGSKSEIRYGPLPQDDPVRRQPDISLANKVIDWKPKVSLEEGLRKTIDYFDDLLGMDSCLGKPQETCRFLTATGSN